MDCMVLTRLGGMGVRLYVGGGASIHSMSAHACACVGEACALF